MTSTRPVRPSTLPAAVEWLIALAVFCVGLAIFYREPVFSGLARISGGPGDGRLYIFLFEHWYKVFAGVAHWSDPPFFYPVRGALGFADAHVAQAPIYAVLKFSGLDRLLSFQLTLFSQNLIGFAAMYVLARRLLGATWWLALAAAWAVAFANGMHGQLSHAQMLTFNYYPVILLFLVGAGRRLERNLTQAALLAVGGGLSLAATFLTGYYVGFFFVLIGCFTVALYALFDWRHLFGQVARLGRRVVVVAMAGLAACLVGLVPFFMLYLPVVLRGAKRDFSEVMHYAPTAADLLNVGSANLLWGWLPQVATSLSPQRLLHTEAMMAPLPILVLGAIALWVWLLRRDRPATKRQLRICAALFFASGILLLITVNIGGWSAWWVIWKFVPGGTGLRVPFRIGIATSFALVLIVVILGTALLRTSTRDSRRIRAAALAALSVLIAASQINLQSKARLDRAAENRWIAALPPPPAPCRSFFAIDSRFRPQVSIFASVFLNVDAMLIAQQTALPTINGYSSVVPPGWAMLRRDQSGAVANAHRWIARHSLADGLCVYDRATNRWHIGTAILKGR